jgi:putative DNA primase/helicase
MIGNAPQRQEPLEFGEQEQRRLTTSVGNLPSGRIDAPRPLPAELPPVEPFEVRLLPAALAPWVMDTWERMQCPPDYPAVAAMVALAGVVGRRVAIGPQAETDWLVVPNLWGLLVGRPGLLKSPAMEAMLAPLKVLVQEASDAFQGALAEHEAALLAHKLRRDAAEKAARQRLARDPSADIVSDLLAIPPEAPHQKRYLSSDSSVEALGELMRQNPDGILVHRDEIMSLLKWLDREDNAAARGFYLTAWNGDSGYTFDRIGRGLNLHVPALCLSLLGSTQPGRLAGYVRSALHGGSGDDGLLQRFGLLVWPDVTSQWREIDRPPHDTARQRGQQVFRRLASLDGAEIGAEMNEHGPPILRFAPDALALFRRWRADLEHRLRAGEMHLAMESHLAKYRKLVPALALLCHLVDEGRGPVNEVATMRALGWAEYLESHARRVYAAVTLPEVAAARAVLNRIRRGDLTPPFSGWQVWRPGWSGLDSRPVVQEALELLTEYGWLRAEHQDAKTTGGRPSTQYHAHPEVMGRSE